MAGKYAAIGARIKKLRQAAGFRSAQAFADEVGVSRATVSAWESGKHYPARFMGVIEKVLGPVEDDGGLSPEVQATIRNMTPEQREHAIQFLTALLAEEAASRRRAARPEPGQRGNRRAES